MNIRNVTRIVLIGLVIAALLTAFYLVHEDLPRPLRSITSLILAPVAIASGLSPMLHLGEVYGSLPTVFIINFLSAAIGVSLFLFLKNRRKQARKRTSIK